MQDYSFNEYFDRFPLAMAYVPWQHLTNIFENLDEAHNMFAEDLDALKTRIIFDGLCGKLTIQQNEDGNVKQLLNKLSESKKEFVKKNRTKKEKYCFFRLQIYRVSFLVYYKGLLHPNRAEGPLIKENIGRKW